MSSTIENTPTVLPQQREGGNGSGTHNVVTRRLADKRAAAGLSLAEVAAASGLSENYLLLIEDGDTIPPVHTSVHIAHAIAQASYDKKTESA